MRLMIKILIVVSIFTLINPVVIGDNIKEYNDLNGRRNQEGKIIYWNLTTNGTIYSPDTSSYGHIIEVGYADGNGTINLFCEYYIQRDVTLIIEPGVEIIADITYHVRFQVYGTLIAVGTENNRIEFYSSSKGAKWEGFRFYSESSAKKSRIEYCNITNGVIDLRSASPIISNNIIINYALSGIVVGGRNSNPIIANNSISQLSAGHAIDCYHSHPIIENNIINNKIEGMKKIYADGICLDESNAIIKNNVIKNCDEGISILGTSKPIINNNTIINIEEEAIYNSDSNPNTINAEYNYWGTIDEKEIRKKIEGKVDYEPWIDENGNVYYSTGQIDDDESFKISFEFGLFIIVIIIAIAGIIIWWRRKKHSKRK